MAIVSFIGAYSISSLAQYILSLYLGQWPLLASVVMNIILVVGLTPSSGSEEISGNGGNGGITAGGSGDNGETAIGGSLW